MQIADFVNQTLGQRDVFRAALEKSGALDPDRLEDMEKHAKELIEAAVQYAEAAPYQSEEEAAYPVYAEEVRHA